jgi:hypothetical protein
LSTSPAYAAVNRTSEQLSRMPNHFQLTRYTSWRWLTSASVALNDIQVLPTLPELRVWLSDLVLSKFPASARAAYVDWKKEFQRIVSLSAKMSTGTSYRLTFWYMFRPMKSVGSYIHFSMTVAPRAMALETPIVSTLVMVFIRFIAMTPSK